MTGEIPIEYVRGTDEVTLWLWPNEPDTVTVRLEKRAWAKLERKAEKVADGDMSKLIGAVLSEDAMRREFE